MSALVVAGDVSGSCTLQAPSAAGSTVLTLPVIATDTLAGIAATQTLTNKTLTSPALSGTVTGTYTLGGTPTLTAPALGTPASGVLTNCTGVAAAALPAGSVLQVVNVVKLTSFSTTSASFVDITGLTASITPSSTNSKILALVTYSRGAGVTGSINLLRGATNLLQPTTVQTYSASSVNFTAVDSLSAATIICLDSPASVSAVTYKCQVKTSSGTVYIGNRSSNDMEMVSTITLMEIQG